MVALLSTLALLLGCILTGALPSPERMTEQEFEEQGVWGPTAVWYWRCRPPSTVEVSHDLEVWQLSSVCLGETCCSMFADGPLCTKEACGLTGEDALEVTMELGPGRPEGIDWEEGLAGL